MKKAGEFITENYKKIMVGLGVVMTVCALNLSIGLGQAMTEYRVRTELEKEKQIAIAEMQIQTQTLLEENGCKWDNQNGELGTKVVKKIKISSR